MNRARVKMTLKTKRIETYDDALNTLLTGEHPASQGLIDHMNEFVGELGDEVRSELRSMGDDYHARFTYDNVVNDEVITGLVTMWGRNSEQHEFAHGVLARNANTYGGS